MHVCCPNCKSEYQVADQFEGKSLKCAACQSVFRARLNRAAIKHHQPQTAPTAKWPTTIPTLRPKRNYEPLMKVLFGIVGLAAVVGLVVAMTFVYLANSEENKQLLENDSPDVQAEAMQ